MRLTCMSSILLVLVVVACYLLWPQAYPSFFGDWIEAEADAPMEFYFGDSILTITENGDRSGNAYSYKLNARDMTLKLNELRIENEDKFVVNIEKLTTDTLIISGFGRQVGERIVLVRMPDKENSQN